MSNPGQLQRMCTVGGKSFNGGDFASYASRQRTIVAARPFGATVDEHGASSTKFNATTVLGTGET